MKKKVEKKLPCYDFNLPLVCNLCKGKYHPGKKWYTNAHGTYCDGTCWSHSGGNAILTVFFFSILGKVLWLHLESSLPQLNQLIVIRARKKTLLSQVGVWLPITTIVLFGCRDWAHCVLENSAERPWPCPLWWVVCCWLIILGQNSLLSAL